MSYHLPSCMFEKALMLYLTQSLAN